MRTFVPVAAGVGDHQLALGLIATACRDALRQRIGLHELLEQGEAERAVLVARVAEFGLGALHPIGGWCGGHYRPVLAASRKRWDRREGPPLY